MWGAGNLPATRLAAMVNSKESATFAGPRSFAEPGFCVSLQSLLGVEPQLSVVFFRQSGYLDRLRQSVKATILSEAIDEFLKTDPLYVVRLGLRKLGRLAELEMGREPRLGDLTGQLLTLIAQIAGRFLFLRWKSVGYWVPAGGIGFG